MGLIAKLFSRENPAERMRPLYAQIVERARSPHWYEQGQVPDSIDGRFDMVTALLCLVLIRLEGDNSVRQDSVYLSEIFVHDMDGQLREIGIGDVTVGKHVGKMMGALGGRLGAYRGALSGEGDLVGAIRRNIYREGAVADEPLGHARDGLCDHFARLQATGTEAILSGEAQW